MRLLVLILCLCTNASWASYAVLDVDQVVNDSVAYVEFKATWDKVNKKYKQEIEDYERKIGKLDKAIASSNNSQDSTDSRKVLGEYEIIVQKLMQKRTKVLDQSMVAALDKLREEIAECVKIYAENNDVDLVIPKSQIIYSDADSDITFNIVAILNNRLQKINIEIER